MTLHYRETDAVSARWTGNTGAAGIGLYQVLTSADFAATWRFLHATEVLVHAVHGEPRRNRFFGRVTSCSHSHLPIRQEF